MNKAVIRIALILLCDFLTGRRLAHTSALHTFMLPKRIRRFLFIADIAPPVVSIAAIIWQILLYLTIICFVLAPLFFDFDSVIRLFYRVTLFEWLAVALPLFLYAGISEIILKKR